MLGIKNTVNTNIYYIGDTFETLSSNIIDHYLSNKFYLSYDRYEMRMGYWGSSIFNNINSTIITNIGY